MAVSHGTGTHVEELISFLACPPCPWDGDNESDVILSENGGGDGGLIVMRLRELCKVLQGYEKDSSSSGFSLSISVRIPMGGMMEGCLVEEVEDVADDDQKSESSVGRGMDGRLKTLGMDVLQHVCGLYSAWCARVNGSEVVQKMIKDIKGILERHEGTAKLVDRAMPDILQNVHGVVVAHVDFEDNSSHSVSLIQYAGPGEWERYLRSMELLWLLENLSYDLVTVDEFMMICRTIALGCKDVSYRVRNRCLEALDIFIDQLDQNDMLEKHENPLSEILSRSMSANDERCWDGTYTAVSRMVKALPPEKKAKLLAQSIEQARKNSHSLIFASSWMHAMNPCFEAAGIVLVEYATILLPTLLEWVDSLLEDVQCSALDALYIYIRACWPRNHAHARTVWGILQRHYTTNTTEISTRVWRVAEVLYVTSGLQFRESIRESRPTDDLSLAIMKQFDQQSIY